MPRPVNKSATYFPGLDGLRTVAVALVVAYHIGVPHAGGGLLGVGVFFTLSGFLITSLLISRWRKHGKLDLKGFWIRRFRRLLPAVVLLLLAVLLATLFVDSHNMASRSKESLAALFYVANWYTIFSGKSYFEQQEGPSPLDHLWSLAVEEQYYIVWPLLLIGIIVACRGNFKKMAMATFGLGLISMILLAVLADPSGDSTRAYEGTDTRAGGLLWGAALAMMWQPSVVERLRPAATWVFDVIGVLGLVGIFTLVATTTQQSNILYTWGIAALTVSTCMVLMPLVIPNSVLGKVMGIAPLRWVGERSYGIYLWHMPVVAFLPERSFYGQAWVRGGIVVILTVVLASLSWRFVEDPIRRHGFFAIVTGRIGGSSDATGTSVAGRGARGLAMGGAGVLALSAAALAGVANLPQKSVVEIAKEANGGKVTTPSAAAASKKAAHPQANKTSCEKVIHIGDSTSLGPGNTPETRIPDKSKRITARYEAVGVKTVIEDILGGRSMLEHMGAGGKDDTASEAMAGHANEIGNGCWVVNIGLNDAANMAKANAWAGADARIASVMKESKGRPVLWVNALTMPWTNNQWYANENVQKFDKILAENTKKYPNLWVYDWSAEATPHPEWFLPDDANHNNEAGSVAKAQGMAKALVAAFPQGQENSKNKIVLSK